MPNSTSPQARPQHILQLNEEQRRRFVDSFDRVYSDIDGVVWHLAHNEPYAGDGYASLERAGKQISFVTNNSVRSVDRTVQSLGQIGIHTTPEQIWHPAKTTIHYLRSIQFEGLIYIMATQQFKTQLREEGYQLIDGPNEIIEENIQDLARSIFDTQPVRAVILDMDFNLTYAKMLRAQIYLRHPDCQLLIGATDRLLPLSKDQNIIGPGAFASILVEASGKQAKIMGKPGRDLGNMLIQQHNISVPSRVLMIGDMLAQDIHFGRLCGFQTLLVLSGGCTLPQLQAETSPDQLPDYYADSVADFVQFFAELTPKAHV